MPDLSIQPATFGSPALQQALCQPSHAAVICFVHQLLQKMANVQKCNQKHLLRFYLLGLVRIQNSIGINSSIKNGQYFFFASSCTQCKLGIKAMIMLNKYLV